MAPEKDGERDEKKQNKNYVTTQWSAGECQHFSVEFLFCSFQFPFALFGWAFGDTFLTELVHSRGKAREKNSETR